MLLRATEARVREFGAVVTDGPTTRLLLRLRSRLGGAPGQAEQPTAPGGARRGPAAGMRRAHSGVLGTTPIRDSGRGGSSGTAAMPRVAVASPAASGVPASLSASRSVPVVAGSGARQQLSPVAAAAEDEDNSSTFSSVQDADDVDALLAIGTAKPRADPAQMTAVPEAGPGVAGGTGALAEPALSLTMPAPQHVAPSGVRPQAPPRPGTGRSPPPPPARQLPAKLSQAGKPVEAAHPPSLTSAAAKAEVTAPTQQVAVSPTAASDSRRMSLIGTRIPWPPPATLATIRAETASDGSTEEEDNDDGIVHIVPRLPPSPSGSSNEGRPAVSPGQQQALAPARERVRRQARASMPVALPAGEPQSPTGPAAPTRSQIGPGAEPAPITPDSGAPRSSPGTGRATRLKHLGALALLKRSPRT